MPATERKYSQLPHDSRRRVQRDQVNWRTVMTRAGSKRQSIRIFDISPLGMSARCEAPDIAAELLQGETLRVLLPLVGEAEAVVVWSLAGHLGASFTERVPAATYARLLATLRTGRGDWLETV